MATETYFRWTGEPERGSRRKHLQKIVKNVTFDCYEQAVHYNRFN